MHIEISTLEWQGGRATGITVYLPKTKVLILTTSCGYVMCGLLDIPILDRLHRDREILAAKVVNVASLEDMLHREIHEVTIAAHKIGLRPGMQVKAALELMQQ